MSWADDEDDVPSAAVAPFHPSIAAVASQPRPSLLAPSLPDRDFRESRAPDSRTPRASAAQPRLADNPKSACSTSAPPTSPSYSAFAAKGVQGQRDDIARIQRKLSSATGPVTTLADRMGENPWSKSAAPATPNAAAVGTPRQSQPAPEPQRKPLVLAPRTQPLPVFPVPVQGSAQTAAPAAAVGPAAAPSIPVSNDVIPKPSAAPVIPPARHAPANKLRLKCP